MGCFDFVLEVLEEKDNFLKIFDFSLKFELLVRDGV